MMVGYKYIFSMYMMRAMEKRVHRFRRCVNAFRQPLKEYIAFLTSLSPEEYYACMIPTNRDESITIITGRDEILTIAQIIGRMTTREKYSLRDFLFDIGIFNELDNSDDCPNTWFKQEYKSQNDFCYIPGEDHTKGVFPTNQLRYAFGKNCERGAETTNYFGHIEMYRLLESSEMIQLRITKALKFEMKDYLNDLLLKRDSEAYELLFSHLQNKPLNQKEIIKKMSNGRYTLAQFWEDVRVITKQTPEYNQEESAEERYLWKNRFIPGRNGSGGSYFIQWKAQEIGKKLNYMLDGPGKMSMKTMQGILMKNFIDPNMYRNKSSSINFIYDPGNMSHINDAANPYVI